MHPGRFFRLKSVIRLFLKVQKIPEAIVFHSDPYYVLSTTVLNDKGDQVTKPIIVVKICYKLLYVIQVVKKIFDK